MARRPSGSSSIFHSSTIHSTIVFHPPPMPLLRVHCQFSLEQTSQTMCTPPMQPTQPPFLWLGDVSLFRCELLTACQVGAFSLSESASSVQSNSVFRISFLHILSSFHLFATCQPDKLFQFFPLKPSNVLKNLSLTSALVSSPLFVCTMCCFGEWLKTWARAVA